MENRVHIWKPLDPERWQIRVFVLLPSTNPLSPPRGELVITSLHNHARYDAISYAWGKAQDTRPLFLEDLTLPITKTLYACLQHFRHPTEKRRLWIDSICVNQFDLDERGQQVQFMEHIFSGALTVHVWLGSGSRNVDQAFQIVRQIGQGVSIDAITIDSNRVQKRDLSLIQYFTSNTWWTRLWILQEVALARSIVFHYGQRELELTSVLNYRDKAIKSVTFEVIKDREAHITIYRSWDKLTQFGRLAELLKRSATYPLGQKCQELINVLCESRLADTSNSKDRVFGFLGVCAALFETQIVQARYNADVQEIYTDFAYRIMSVSQTLLLLGQASSHHNLLTELPSWVPDWSSHYDFATERVRLRLWTSTYNACAGVPIGRISRHNTHLGLTGLVLDSVAVVGDVCHQGLLRNDDWDHGDPEAVHAVVNKWSSTYNDYMMWMYNILEDKERFLSLMTEFLDHERLTGNPQRVKKEMFHQIMSWLASPKPGTQPKPEIDYFMAAIGKRRLILGFGGCVGVGPQHTRKGDVVALLCGGTVPYIIRPCGGDVLEGPFKFIGECYISGVMFGENVKSTDFRDIWLQ